MTDQDAKRYRVLAGGYINGGGGMAPFAIGEFDTLADALACPIPHDSLWGAVQDRELGLQDVAGFHRKYSQRRNRDWSWHEIVERFNGIAYLDRGETLTLVVWSEQGAYSAMSLDDQEG